MSTKVIFRTYKGAVTAIFPEESGTRDPNTMMCYEKVGQHGITNVEFCRRARLSTVEEYTPLKKELESLGYELNIKYRSCPNYKAKRIEKLNYV